MAPVTTEYKIFIGRGVNMRMKKIAITIAILSFLCILSGLMSNGTKEPNKGTKTLTTVPKVISTPGKTEEAKTEATKVKAIGLTMLDKPIADLLTATEDIVIKDQEEAKTATGKIKITYIYQDGSELAIICESKLNGLMIYNIE